MNSYDSAMALGFLAQHGWEPTGDETDADLILFNTCSVREHAETRVYGRLHALKEVKKQNPRLILGLLGCMVEEHREKLFEKFPYLDILCGTRNLRELPELVEKVRASRTQASRIKQEGIGIEYLETAVRSSKFHNYLPIMTGCDKTCTYCIVPLTRGREISMPSQEILREARRLAGIGVKHITLLGQNVNSYGKGAGNEISFVELLRKLHEIDGFQRISFTTSHPGDATRELFEALRDLPKILRRLHLPLQSGSNAILKRMGRLHTIEDFKNRAGLLRQLVPGISVTTDIIVGFPGETEGDYEATKSALLELQFDGAFVYKYSERPGTPAARLKDDVSLGEKKRRNEELLDLQKEITRENNEKWVGMVDCAMIEGPSAKDASEYLAFNSQDKKVVLSRADSGKVNIGDLVQVKLVSLIGDTFRACLL